MKRNILAFFTVLIAFALFAEDQAPRAARLANEMVADKQQLFNNNTPGVVSWAHIGDLHITTPEEKGYTDFQILVKQANQYLAGSVNFVFLPGDNANEGDEQEYQLIKRVTDRLQIPLVAVPGDHDAEGGGLDLFLKYMTPVPYQSFTIDGYRMIFLNALDSTPEGELGFGLSDKQKTWLTEELKAAQAAGQRVVLFQHCFPEETGSSGQELLDLIRKNHVLLAEVGHTHFNAVSNDGQTIYAATRSTSQVEEGPVGFSITNLDGGVVSWKFKPIGGWPFVMITSPADKRFITDPSDANQVVHGDIEIHAKVWGGGEDASVTYTIDKGEPKALARKGSAPLWSADLDSTTVEPGDHTLTVTVHTKDGQTAEDQTILLVDQKGSYVAATRSAGASGNSIGVDQPRGLLGTTHGHGRKPSWAGKGKPDKAHDD